MNYANKNLSWFTIRVFYYPNLQLLRNAFDSQTVW